MMASLSDRLYDGSLELGFVRNRRRWYLISAVLVLICVGGFFLRGLNLGLEFRGGTEFQLTAATSQQAVDEVRDLTSNSQVADLDAQVFALGSETIRVQTRPLEPSEITTVRAELADYASISSEDVTYNSIGPSWGQRISQQATVALVVFVALVMVLIAVWFRDWRMSLAAMIPLVHDVILTVGVYALFGFLVTPATLIGVLTILGYSLYDTVVVFDQIRRTTQGVAPNSAEYSSRVNRAVNQVLVRSLNTTVIGILPVIGLVIAGVILGGGPLGELGIALLVGMVVGAYSSLFLAAPLLVEFNRGRRVDTAEQAAEVEPEPQIVGAELYDDDGAEESEPVSATADTAPAAADRANQAAPVQPTVRHVRRTRSTRAERKNR